MQNVQFITRPRLRSRAIAVLFTVLAVAATTAVTATRGVAKTASVKKVQVVDDLFKPTKVKIKTGQKVKWTWSSQNLDAHNVTLLKGPSGVSSKSFTSKTKTRNYTFTKKFTVAGKYEFVCTIHPGMGITVTVKK